MIVIIDYDTGNTKSISKALDFIGLQNKISSDTTEIAQADGVILPGVGAYPEAMKELTRRGLNKTLKEIGAVANQFLVFVLVCNFYSNQVTNIALLMVSVSFPVMSKNYQKIPNLPFHIWAGINYKSNVPPRLQNNLMENTFITFTPITPIAQKNTLSQQVAILLKFLA